MTYTFTCAQGHEPETFSVEAENDQEALQKIMAKSGPHVAKVHAELANMPEDQAKQMIISNLVKS